MICRRFFNKPLKENYSPPSWELISFLSKNKVKIIWFSTSQMEAKADRMKLISQQPALLLTSKKFIPSLPKHKIFLFRFLLPSLFNQYILLFLSLSCTVIWICSNTHTLIKAIIRTHTKTRANIILRIDRT